MGLSNCCARKQPASPDGRAPRLIPMVSEPHDQSLKLWRPIQYSSWSAASYFSRPEDGVALRAIFDGDVSCDDMANDSTLKDRSTTINAVKKKLRKHLHSESASTKRGSRASVGNSEEEIARRKELKQARNSRIREELSDYMTYDDDATFVATPPVVSRLTGISPVPGSLMPAADEDRVNLVGFECHQPTAIQAQKTADSRMDPVLHTTRKNSYELSTLTQLEFAEGLMSADEQDTGFMRPERSLAESASCIAGQEADFHIPPSPVLRPRRMPSLVDPAIRRASWRLSATSDHADKTHALRYKQQNSTSEESPTRQVQELGFAALQWLRSQGLCNSSRSISRSGSGIQELQYSSSSSGLYWESRSTHSVGFDVPYMRHDGVRTLPTSDTRGFAKLMSQSYDGSDNLNHNSNSQYQDRQYEIHTRSTPNLQRYESEQDHYPPDVVSGTPETLISQPVNRDIATKNSLEPKSFASETTSAMWSRAIRMSRDERSIQSFWESPTSADMESGGYQDGQRVVDATRPSMIELREYRRQRDAGAAKKYDCSTTLPSSDEIDSVQYPAKNIDSKIYNANAERASRGQSKRSYHPITPPESWARWPSHTRAQRTEAAGADDHVDTYDFATRTLKDGSLVIQKDDDMGKFERQNDKQHKPRFHKKIKQKVKSSVSQLIAKKDALLQGTASGRRSSTSLGGELAYPELEILALEGGGPRELQELELEVAAALRIQERTKRSMTFIDGSVDPGAPQLGLMDRTGVLSPATVDAENRKDRFRLWSLKNSARNEVDRRIPLRRSKSAPEYMVGE